MNWTRLLNGLWVGIIGFLIARCEFVGISPLIVGFFLASCLAGLNTLYVFIGAMIGLFATVSSVDAVRYGIVMLLIAGVLNIKQLLETRGKELAICFLGGSLLSIVSLTFGILGLTRVETWMLILEGAVAFSVGVVYLRGLNILKSDYGRIAYENEAAISCLLLGVTLLFGMPRYLIGGIVLAEAVAIFGMLTVLYKFGFGIGMCWCMATGFVVSYTLGITEYFIAWIIIGALTQGIACVFDGGRTGFGIFYTGVYLLVGTYLYPVILSEDGVKALASAMFVFLLAPKKLMLRIGDRSIYSDLADNSAEWGSLMIDRINNLSRAFKRIEYTLVGDTGTGIGFRDVGNIIESFTNQLERAVPMRKTISSAIISRLALHDIQVKNLVLLKNQEERYEVYITSKVKRGKLVLASVVRNIISEEMGMDMELKDESRNIVSRNYQLICLRQKPAYEAITAVRRLSRYENQVSGDDFYVGDIMDGQKLIILADGMGNGEEAAGDSGFLIEAIEDLLNAGFDKETSIRVVNSYLADRNKGERFSTLDMLVLDLHTGYGRIFKQGAAATLVKRGQWIEVIKSTSLPVGVIDGAVCESCRKKFYNDDVVVMLSDGVLESIVFENKEDYLKDMLLNLRDQNAEEIATAIVEEIRAASGNRLRDDACVIVIKLKKK